MLENLAIGSNGLSRLGDELKKATEALSVKLFIGLEQDATNSAVRRQAILVRFEQLQQWDLIGLEPISNRKKPSISCGNGEGKQG